MTGVPRFSSAGHDSVRKDGYTNELLSGGTTNYFESGTTNSCIFTKSRTTNYWLFSRRIMNSPTEVAKEKFETV